MYVRYGPMWSGKTWGASTKASGRSKEAWCPVIAPEILLALWLYATLDGVGSAREIVRLTEAHDAYRWLCGGVQVNHHTVSDFRKDHGEALDELLSVIIASLMAAGVVKLKQVAQDGIRVRASAGAGSFRRKEKLEGYLEAARSEVARLKAELEPFGAIRPF
jgi:transposase